MSNLPVAVIHPDSPRAAAWRECFGALEVPIRSFVAVRATAPDGRVRQFFQVAVDRLTVEQRDRVVAHVAARWNLAHTDVERDLSGEHGLPILAEDVVAVFDGRCAL